MKIKLLTLALITAIAQPALASEEHNHSADGIHGGFSHIDVGGVESAADSFHRQQLNSRKLSLGLLKSTNAVTANSENVIDVGVVIHQEYINQMKEQLVKDKDGKHYENGAQFAIARIKAKFDFYNDALEKQGFSGRFNPVYYTITSHEITKHLNASESGDFQNVRDCVYWPDTYLNYTQKKDYCTAQGFDKARAALSSKVDLMFYVRPFYEGEAIGGHGGYLSAAADYDAYNIVAKQIVSSGQSYPDAVYESLLFGHYNAQIMMHEFGHVLAAGHEVSDAEPVFGDGSYGRAYACGPVIDTATGEKDYTSKRFTIMARGAAPLTKPHHSFYSDPDIFVEGDACGAVSVADNAKYVSENLPLAANVNTLPTKGSDVFFVQSDLIFNRTEQKGVITIRRTGDLTKPAYVNVLAEDGTAWEQRDFDFGLKEVVFAVGESEKTVEFTMLERSEGHTDTKFNVKMIGAMYATYASEPLNVTIASDKPLQGGQVGFKDSQITTAEGNSVEVLLTRTNGTDGDTTFNVATANGTGTAGVDYKAINQSVTIKSGQSSASITLETASRAGNQGARTVLLSISEVTGATAGTAQATITINDALQSGTVGFATTTVTATESGSAILNITRTNGAEGAVSVNVKTVSGSAIAGTDFNAVDQVVNFADGQTTASVTVALINRSGTQGSRSLSVELSNPVGGVAIGSSVATVAITDAPSQPNQGGDSSEGSSGGSTSIWFLLSILITALVRKVRLQG